MFNKLIQILATVFYLGYVPPASGTVASLVGVVIFLLFHQGAVLYVSILIAVTLIGFYVSGRMEKIAGRKDPSCIVIDEVSGMLIALLGLPAQPAIVITAFFLFRAFDMFKIYPASRFEKLPGGVGIMTDDVVAGLYTNLILVSALKLSGGA